MTREEAREVLLSRLPQGQTVEQLKKDIHHETSAMYDFPYFFCQCGRGSTRFGRCVECLREMLAVAEEQANERSS